MAGLTDNIPLLRVSTRPRPEPRELCTAAGWEVSRVAVPVVKVTVSDRCQPPSRSCRHSGALSLVPSHQDTGLSLVNPGHLTKIYAINTQQRTTNFFGCLVLSCLYGITVKCLNMAGGDPEGSTLPCRSCRASRWCCSSVGKS